MKISQAHSNRKAHNWLSYDIGDKWIARFSHLYRGDLYDLGCGEMPFKSWLLGYANNYIGVDWSSSPHELKADIFADLNKPLQIESAVADTVMSLSVMEHLREPQVFLNEAFRILKPGGAMILQVPFMWGIHEEPYDYYRYTQYGLEHLFRKAGFTEVTIYPQTGFWVMWTLKFNYQSTRIIRGSWLVRKVIGLLMRGIWMVDQLVARWLDKYWKSEGETAGYFVVAKKSA